MSKFDEKGASVEVQDASDLEGSSFEEYSYNHIFRDPAVAEHYRGVYEKCEYECRHLFDPEYTWTKEEEKKVVWKLEWRVTLWAFIMFTSLNFDRFNLSQALSTSFLKDLHMNTNQLNIGNTLNLVFFLISELPSQLISKKIGADVWIPTQIVLWSVVSITQSSITTPAGFYVTRCLLGALQGGFICEVGLWMSYFYTTSEFPLRLSIFYMSNSFTIVISSLLAFALLKIKTEAISQSWRWLFIVEGLLTLVIGLASFFLMPASAAQTKAWYRPNGWFTDHEEKIVVNRVLRDDPSKGDMHNREPVHANELLKTILDYDHLPVYLIRFLIDMGTHPIATYLQIVLRGIGFTTFETNALTIPYSIITIICIFSIGYFSEKVNSRALTLAIVPTWVLSCLIPLRFWPNAQKDKWGTFALLTVLLGHPTDNPLTNSWVSANSNSVRSRAVSTAIVNMFSQAGTIVGANIYREDDRPLYHRGNSALIGINFAALAVTIISRFYYKWRNSQKERAWNELDIKQQEEYLSGTTDEGNKRLDFKFTY
ncbi:MFS general substrate transporter [Suhomyces tanzawaensis NRRL Y-17324]|uniref:MFS general substrate transporter n=1 Tax=Suhomyces tanzawaensis NRRL Y-17324 TaxID=984487 RepID=A0A1E4SET3_9ASCO|nr:MFS general substrate transporter [Suhomyces tanzawaensis NRRL Y-17324]ODV77902.1 MFS general substrate transporter [Suhomyces tanzawaensis NRRL Y-17324]